MCPPTHPSDAQNEAGYYSVGELAEQTGIAPGTLRMWERRYGVPEPVRLPSGHRRYTAAQLRLVRRVAEAMTRGHRPGKLLRASEAELDRLLAQASGEAVAPAAIERWLELARSYDERGLEDALRGAAAALGPLEFLHGRVSPFVRAIGRLWADGELEVHHEHFASEILETVLRSLRASLRAQPGRPERSRILLTTLPGERHGLGLWMAAMLCEVHDVHTHLLGTGTPPDQIVASAGEHAVATVGVGISLAGGGVRTDALLAELRDSLPPGTDLLVGGAGAHGKRRRLKGVIYCTSLSELEGWAKQG